MQGLTREKTFKSKSPVSSCAPKFPGHRKRSLWSGDIHEIVQSMGKIDTNMSIIRSVWTPGPRYFLSLLSAPACSQLWTCHLDYRRVVQKSIGQYKSIWQSRSKYNIHSLGISFSSALNTASSQSFVTPVRTCRLTNLRLASSISTLRYHRSSRRMPASFHGEIDKNVYRPSMSTIRWLGK